MKKLTTTLAGATLATAALFGTAAPANAADTNLSDAEYNKQVQEDWGLMINEYFPDVYIPNLGY